MKMKRASRMHERLLLPFTVYFLLISETVAVKKSKDDEINDFWGNDAERKSHESILAKKKHGLISFGRDEEQKQFKQRYQPQDCDSSLMTRELEELRKNLSIKHEELIKCNVRNKNTAHQYDTMVDIIKCLVLPTNNVDKSKQSSVSLCVLFTEKDMLELKRAQTLIHLSNSQIRAAFRTIKEALKKGNMSAIQECSTNNYYINIAQGSAIGFLAASFILFFVHIRNGVALMRFLPVFFLMTFFLTLPWEWYHMYKKEFAMTIAAAEKYKSNDCDTNKMSVASKMFKFFQSMFAFQEDSCSKYHQAVLVDPFWKVSPLKVFSASLTTVIMLPSEMIAELFAKCTGIIMSGLPIQFQLLMFLAIVVFIIVFTITWSGFEFKVPFMSFRGGVRSVDPNHKLAQKCVQLELENVKLLEKINELQNAEVAAIGISTSEDNSTAEIELIEPRTLGELNRGVLGISQCTRRRNLLYATRQVTGPPNSYSSNTEPNSEQTHINRAEENTRHPTAEEISVDSGEVRKIPEENSCSLNTSRLLEEDYHHLYSEELDISSQYRLSENTMHSPRESESQGNSGNLQMGNLTITPQVSQEETH